MLVSCAQFSALSTWIVSVQPAPAYHGCAAALRGVWTGEALSPPLRHSVGAQVEIERKSLKQCIVHSIQALITKTRRFQHGCQYVCTSGIPNRSSSSYLLIFYSTEDAFQVAVSHHGRRELATGELLAGELPLFCRKPTFGESPPSVDPRPPPMSMGTDFFRPPTLM
jgi:hypothetical protein